jgi:hypothetical protein
MIPRMTIHDYKIVLDEIRRDQKSRDRTGQWCEYIGGIMVGIPSMGVISGSMTMNAAFGWVALGLLVSIIGATYLLRAAAQSVKLLILLYTHIAVQPPFDDDDDD